MLLHGKISSEETKLYPQKTQITAGKTQQYTLSFEVKSFVFLIEQ